MYPSNGVYRSKQSSTFVSRFPLDEISPVIDCIIYEIKSAANVSMADIITLSEIDDMNNPTAIHAHPYSQNPRSATYDSPSATVPNIERTSGEIAKIIISTVNIFRLLSFQLKLVLSA